MSLKILIVEDHPDARDLLTVALEAEGHTVNTATDGREGLKFVQIDCPDIIVSDISMPNMDGIELVRRLRAMPECNKVPILMMSAMGSGDLQGAIDAGANQGLCKPVDLDQMVKAINRLME